MQNCLQYSLQYVFKLRGRSQARFTRRGRLVVQKYQRLYHKNANAREQVVKRSQNPVNVDCKQPPQLELLKSTVLPKKSLRNRGSLKVLNDTKLIMILGGHSNSVGINFSEPSEFRGSLFLKQICTQINGRQLLFRSTVFLSGSSF